MPKRSKIETELPDEILAELNQRIKKAGFGDYRDLSSWLSERGFEISKSALHRHGNKLENQVRKIRAATEQADYLRTMFPDDDGSMTDGLLRSYQAGLFDYMQQFEIEPGSMDPLKLARAIKDISHASISQKRLQKDIRDEMRAEMMAKAEAAVASGDWEQAAFDDARRTLGF